MIEVTDIVQNTFNILALKMVLLIILMFSFALVPMILLNKFRVPGKSQLAGLFSLIGAFVWVKYILI